MGLYSCSTVPTEDQILVPETLLKKRKSQEKAREERSAELVKKKKVGHSKLLETIPEVAVDVDDGDEAYHFSRLDLPGRCCRQLIPSFGSESSIEAAAISASTPLTS